MSTELAVQDRSDISDIVAEAAGEQYTRAQIELIKRTLVTLPKGDTDGVTDMELALCIAQARERHLSPFAKQCWFIRWTKGGPLECYPSWEGILKQALDTKDYQGHEGPFYSADGKEWTEVWLSKDRPVAAKALVWRRGFRVPIVGIATWAGSARTYPDGNPIGKWKDDPLGMLGKCALRLAIRRAFPLEIDDPISGDQLKALHTLASMRGLKERESRLLEAGKIVGRDVSSFKDLSRTEASEVYEEWADDVQSVWREPVEAEVVHAGEPAPDVPGEGWGLSEPPGDPGTDGTAGDGGGGLGEVAAASPPAEPSPRKGWSQTRRNFEEVIAAARQRKGGMATAVVRGFLAGLGPEFSRLPLEEAIDGMSDANLDALTALLVEKCLGAS